MLRAQTIASQCRKLATTIVVCATAFVLRPEPLQADASTGTWTGQVTAHGNYYLETSTRVIMPDFAVEVETPSGLRLGADYLIDVITSASIASGVTEDDLHTELRHAARVSVGKELDVDGTPLDVSAFATFSIEPDYQSWIFGATSALSLNERNTVLQLRVSGVSDTVYNNINPTFEEPMWGLTTRFGVEQVLNRRMLLALAYQYDHLDGFLSNPYRVALRGPLPFPEAHPEQRNRHTADARLQIYFPRPHSSLHLMYSAYLDDWDVAAISPEVRYFMHFTPWFMTRLRYRYYTQTQSYFCCNGDYPTLAEYDGPITNDPKMTEHHTQLIGLRMEVGLGTLQDTVFDFAKDVWLEGTFDRYLNTNAFGNAWIAQLGGRVPF
jgi:hypothetical protein